MKIVKRRSKGRLNLGKRYIQINLRKMNWRMRLIGKCNLIWRRTELLQRNAPNGTCRELRLFQDRAVTSSAGCGTSCGQQPEEEADTGLLVVPASAPMLLLSPRDSMVASTWCLARRDSSIVRRPIGHYRCTETRLGSGWRSA